MIKKLLGAVAVAAIACAFVPAQAARVGVGCSGENLGKTEGAVEGMADGPAKGMAQREIAQAQDMRCPSQQGGEREHNGASPVRRHDGARTGAGSGPLSGSPPRPV